MNLYRAGATQKVASTAFLETDYKSNATVSKKTTGVTAAAEVQNIAVSYIANKVYVLTVGATTLTTAALGASPTINTLVSAIQADAGYDGADFGVAAGTGNELVLTWESNGPITDIASLTVNAYPVGTTTLVRAGATGVKKKQKVAVSALGNYVYKLVVGSITLTTSALGSSPTITTLVNALKDDVDYDPDVFTLTSLYGDTIGVDWTDAGTQADSAVLTCDAFPAGTTEVDTEGATGVVEVQEVTPVLDAQSVYKLTYDSTVLTTAALDASPTIAELNTAIQAATGYGDAPFTTAVSGSKIELTWKAAGAVSGVSTLQYREYIEGPYTTAMEANTVGVRVICDAACNLKIGVGVEAGASDMLLPANTVEYFKISPGDRVSFKGSTANLYVTPLYA